MESPDSLLSNRSVHGLHGLHGLFSGSRRRVIPTRRERVEQESPLLLSLPPCPLVLPPSQHPKKGGLWPPTGGLADRDGDAGEALEFACKGKCFLGGD